MCRALLFFLMVAIVFQHDNPASAQPNSNSLRKIGFALRTCQRAMDGSRTGRAVSERTKNDYLKDRDEAFKRDPSVKTFHSAHGEFNPVDEWIRKCDSFFARVGQNEPSKEARDLMYKAFDKCWATLFRPGTLEKTQNAWQQYQALRDQAIKADSRITSWNGVIKGQVVSKRILECDTKLKALLGNSEKQVAKSKEVQKKRAEERKKEDEQRQMAFQKLLDSLKGDRRRILTQHGHEPSDYRGKLHTASVWKYKTYPSTRGPSWHCTTTYTFKGNKLVNKRKRGPYCSGCTTCP